MPLILPARTLDSGFNIDNSLRFNDDDNAFLSRTPSSSGSRTIATVSFWVKRGNLKASGDHFMLEASSSTSPFNMTRVRFSNDLLVIDNTLNGSAANGFMFQSNREYRDPSAFYHIFFSIDVTQANATDGWLLYVNGVQQTKALSFWTQNANLEFSQSSVQMNIGRRHDNTNDNLDGCLAEYHYIDGTRKLYTDFGEFNDNGVWIPKEYTGGSYGTNGFYMEFKQSGTGTNASGMGADTSGNTNHFAVSNLTATDQTTDTPTNNFCTWNPLIGRSASYATFAEGNLDADFTSGSTYFRATGSIGVTSGKWYAEIKCIDDGGNNDLKIGVEHASPDQTTIDGVHKVIQSWNGYKASGGSAASFGDSYTNGDIVGVYLDMDNGTIKFSKNGTMMASGASAYTDLISAMPDSGWAFFAYGYDNANVQANFGNAPFSISSGNADANGYGNFEYSPTLSGVNYYALCTKNLAEYG